MASLPTCDQPFQISGQYLYCPGNLVNVEYIQPSTFDVSQINPATVVEAIGSGFIVAGVPFLTIMCARIVLKSINGKSYEK